MTAPRSSGEADSLAGSPRPASTPVRGAGHPESSAAPTPPAADRPSPDVEPAPPAPSGDGHPHCTARQVLTEPSQ